MGGGAAIDGGDYPLMGGPPIPPLVETPAQYYHYYII